MDKTDIVGTIKLFAGSFCPDGYLYCDGQEILITSNLVLYNIIGTRYGGDGKKTFAIPKLNTDPDNIGVKYIICVSGLYPSH
jgi:microcystin-dependent protein